MINLNNKAYEMNNHYNKALRDTSRILRNNSVSKAEKFLWKALLSRKQLGVGFKRQRPIGDYIVDFFAAEVGLIVEIDGSSHMRTSANDRMRQNCLEAQGYSIIRLTEREILNDFEAVKTRLVHAVYCLKDD
jgi:very-short-patch-repair endonuclease